MSTRFHMANGALLALAALLGGCASTTPQLDARFGNALRAADAAQVIDPAAARNANPVAGLDGRSAAAAQARYEHAAGSAGAPPSVLGTVGIK